MDSWGVRLTWFDCNFEQVKAFLKKVEAVAICLSYVQTDATTPNNVGICSASWKDTRLWRPRGPNNVGRAVQKDATLLC